MIGDIFKYLGLLILLVVIQILVLDNINFGNSLTFLFQPQIVIMFVLLLPANINHIWLIIIAFFAGLLLDSLCNTYGINAAILTLIGFLRFYFTNDLNDIISKAPNFDILLITKIYNIKLEELYTKWVPGIYSTACYIISKKGLDNFISHSSYNIDNNNFQIN